MEFLMTNKTALITGASSGIGKEIAKQLFLQGYNLLLVSRDIERLKSAQQNIKLLPAKGEIDLFQADLSEQKAAEKIFNYTQQNNIKIDVLVNNAGAGMYGEICKIDKIKFYQMLMLNTYSLTCLCQLYSQQMSSRKSGHILNIASLAAYQPVPYIAAYAASKSYVLNFSEAIAMELEDQGVTVSCFSPGHTDTNFFSEAHIPDTDKFYSIKTRIKPDIVAKNAIDCLFKQKLSKIQGIKNTMLSSLNKFGTRKIVAKISKKLVSKAHQ